MILQDVINDALAAELHNIAVPNKITVPTGSTLTTQQYVVSLWINQALVAIARRIPIEQKEVVFALVTDAVVNTGGERYNLPTDCMNIISVYGENGIELPMNDESEPESIFTPTYSSIQVPNPELGTYISVIYNAEPVKLTELTDILPVPASFEDAILAYVAMKAQTPLGVEQQTENNVYYMRYKLAVDDLINTGMVTVDGLKEALKFNNAGWR